jgi:hypothetical protein
MSLVCQEMFTTREECLRRNPRIQSVPVFFSAITPGSTSAKRQSGLSANSASRKLGARLCVSAQSLVRSSRNVISRTANLALLASISQWILRPPRGLALRSPRTSLSWPNQAGIGQNLQRRLSRHRSSNGFVNLVPATPTYDSQFWLWGIRQHRKQLEHISIWVTEIERCSGHPSKHHWFVGRLPPKVEWNNIGCPKTRRGVQQVLEICPKGNVKTQPLGTSRPPTNRASSCLAHQSSRGQPAAPKTPPRVLIPEFGQRNSLSVAGQ